MELISTFDALIHRIQTHPNTDVRTLLAGVLDSLTDYQDYDLSELAFIAIIAESDGLESLTQALPSSLLAPDGQPAVQPEVVEHAGAWTQLTYILSDDGYGAGLSTPRRSPRDSSTWIEANSLRQTDRKLPRHGPTGVNAALAPRL